MGTDLIRTRREMRAALADLRGNGASIAFVPTMGALHEGHLSLVKLATEQGSRVVVSIFVNPLQFNVAADLEAYPRDEERDVAMLRELGVDLVFVPPVDEVYLDGHLTTVSVAKLSERFEGAGRPGHFDGVATVLTILFQIVQPDIAVFGEKDFQQLRLVEQLVRDLAFPIEIIRGPLIREPDGLAMSSRNVRLSSDGRKAACKISQALFAARERYFAGEREVEAILSAARQVYSEEHAIRQEYLEIVDEESLEPVERINSKRYRLLTTVYVEGVRLLDNLALS